MGWIEWSYPHVAALENEIAETDGRQMELEAAKRPLVAQIQAVPSTRERSAGSRRMGSISAEINALDRQVPSPSCPGRNPPFAAVKRRLRPYECATQH